ncbi:Splicing factor 3A subunit 3like [Caligus rogercresseyi]|uniref:Splicing factor 3A subunit 3like n=1 Tax=Caligus rogercresseyi TaxID=217165 RepID=A0A7T8JZ96_CALRO|nr:Splicing factor 3A subunit 3like [Caligus rogercresseyi]
MEGLLEQQRHQHEERERLMDLLVAEVLQGKKASHRESLNSEHRQRRLLDRYASVTQGLVDIYEDEDGGRRDEISALSGEFSEFYGRLKGLKEFHKRHSVVSPMALEFDALKKEISKPGDQQESLVEFAGEEGYGRYLDLHEPYEAFMNLKGAQKDSLDYIAYLSVFHKLDSLVPRERKGADYKKYLIGLIEYLDGFTRKIKPLLDLDGLLQEAITEANQKFSIGECPGWPKENASGSSSGALANSGGAHLDLSAFSSPEELASLGLDRLKSALIALDLKCGGTLEERAKRLFSTKGKSLQELDASLFAKKAGIKRVAVTIVYKYADILAETRDATKENVERKQARTEFEREDSDDEMSEDDAEDNDEDDIPYNPKNLPLGWDGKPIPYWLYKLHGLNISYNCEICGNFTYKGPKAFQRHFAEWRHAHGMRCLGIPNTAHFANVTQIEDAMALWEKLKSQKIEEAWKPDMEEEFEDSQGNVVNKKIFEDLKRQGLL